MHETRASVQQARAIDPNAHICIIVSGERAATIARDLGLKPIDLWKRDDFIAGFLAMLHSEGIGAMVANGADIIDGIYGVLVPGRMAYCADIAARIGVGATILGSSFSKQSRAELVQAFDEIGPDVAVCLRDQPSLDRFAATTKATPTLVADSAFMMQTGEPDAEAGQWIARRREAGRLVLGFNLHPMLVKEDPERVRQLIASSVSSLRASIGKHTISWVLIPHDRRGVVGDLVVLQAAYDALVGEFGDDLLLIDASTRTAADLKAIAGALDGVVTGRMHLAIGSLGKGVPVLCVTYQDKFEGLFSHFDLPEAMLLSTPRALEPAVLEKAIDDFVADLSGLREIVVAALPAVQSRSRKNYEKLRASLGAETGIDG